MDLETEFLSVMPKMGQISFKVDDDISVFESIIRYLGGFLSAFELSDRKQDILIKKAEKLAEELLPAFDTPSGLPHHFFNPLTSVYFKKYRVACGNLYLSLEVNLMRMKL